MTTATAELLTVPEVMARLKLGRSTVYDLIRSRRLVSITIGRARRVPADAVQEFIDNRIEESACWPPSESATRTAPAPSPSGRTDASRQPSTSSSPTARRLESSRTARPGPSATPSAAPSSTRSTTAFPFRPVR